mmetsp:Transcript_13870/g.26632  ORF Transcript_13870/g.26632 Transcript_13870/m.26632 type:complete len:261 (+) Transcript_13870:362-1144(+)
MREDALGRGGSWRRRNGSRIDVLCVGVWCGRGDGGKHTLALQALVLRHRDARRGGVRQKLRGVLHHLRRLLLARLSHPRREKRLLPRPQVRGVHQRRRALHAVLHLLSASHRLLRRLVLGELAHRHRHSILHVHGWRRRHHGFRSLGVLHQVHLLHGEGDALLHADRAQALLSCLVTLAQLRLLLLLSFELVRHSRRARHESARLAVHRSNGRRRQPGSHRGGRATRLAVALEGAAVGGCGSGYGQIRGRQVQNSHDVRG